MTNEEKAAQLELAAKIIREGLEWEVESFCGTYWQDGEEVYTTVMVALSEEIQIRIKPAKPAPQTWDCPDDVPPVCWIRKPHIAPACFLVDWVGNNVIGWHNQNGREYVNFSSGELSKYEHSTDRKNWKPCTK